MSVPLAKAASWLRQYLRDTPRPPIGTKWQDAARMPHRRACTVLKGAESYAATDDELLDFFGGLIIFNAPFSAKHSDGGKRVAFNDPGHLLVRNGATFLRSVWINPGRGRRSLQLVEPMVDMKHVKAIGRNIREDASWTSWIDSPSSAASICGGSIANNSPASLKPPKPKR